MSKKNHVLIGVTASIAAYKSCEIISALRKSGYEVKVAMSQDAKHFITALTLQTISGNKVASDMFELPAEWDIVHVTLAKWADLILVAPATADMIGKLAHGRADCVVSATILSSKADILIAPAMNDNMYLNKTVRSNIKTLKSLGYNFIGPVKGNLACGNIGIGHLASVSEIVKTSKDILK